MNLRVINYVSELTEGLFLSTAVVYGNRRQNQHGYYHSYTLFLSYHTRKHEGNYIDTAMLLI